MLIGAELMPWLAPPLGAIMGPPGLTPAGTLIGA
jgi:hypothetical protein